MGVNLTFEAGRLAERRGWASAEVLETGALASVLPGPGEVIVVASEAGLAVADARAVAALASSGKKVAVVTEAALSDDVLAWLPKPESTGDLGGWGGAVTQKCPCSWGEWEFLTLPHPVEEGHFVDATVSYPGGAVGVVR